MTDTKPTLADAIIELRRPFTPEAVKWKIQTNPKPRGDSWSSALIVAFMDSRLAAERLNTVCPGDWSDAHVPGLIPNSIVCELTVLGSTRSDAGWVDRNKLDSDMGLKGVYSDAFKRAAVKFGIGAFLYSLPKVYLPVTSLKQVGRGERINWYLTDAANAELRQRYQRWLRDSKTIEHFGEPLDHGDVEDSQGDPDERPPEVDVAASNGAPTPPPIPSERAEAIVNGLRDAQVKRGQIRMWLIEAGVESVPSTGDLGGVLRGLTVEQADVFEARLNGAVAA